MTNADMLRLYRGLQALAQLPGVKFSYWVARNLKALEGPCTALEKSLAPSPEYIAYERARVGLAAEHAVKDADNNPLVKNNQYVIADQSAFDAALAALREQHAEAIAKHEPKVEEWSKLLEEEAAGVATHKIRTAVIPEFVTAAQLLAIYEVLEEDAPPTT